MKLWPDPDVLLVTIKMAWQKHHVDQVALYKQPIGFSGDKTANGTIETSLYNSLLYRQRKNMNVQPIEDQILEIQI